MYSHDGFWSDFDGGKVARKERELERPIKLLILKNTNYRLLNNKPPLVHIDWEMYTMQQTLDEISN